MQVSKDQICTDLATPQFQWDHPSRPVHKHADHVSVFEDAYEACQDAHAVAVLTEWDQFAQYDWERIYDSMLKPSFLFDGR